MRRIVTASLLALTITSSARADDLMTYGQGGETCRQALTHDWLAGKEVAWISGFMTFASAWMPAKELDPGAKDSKRLIALVYKQCKHEPEKTLVDVTSTIVAHIFQHQKAASNAELEGVF